MFFPEMDKEPIIRTIIPRISFILSFITAMLTALNLNQDQFIITPKMKFYLFSLSYGISFLMVFGKNAFILCLLLFFVIRNYLKIMQNLNLYENVQTLTYVATISYFFWYAFGNKPQIAALQVANAYVGFEHFNYYSSGILLIINCGASFLLTGLIIPFYASFKIENKILMERETNNESVKLNYIKCVMYFGFYFLTTLMCTSANCIVQRRALLLIEDFAPKFFFDGCIFIFANCILIILMVFFAV